MPQTVVRVYRSADESVPFVEWLDDLRQRKPDIHAKCLQRIQLLADLGYELRRPLADSLRDGVYELRIRAGKVNYRILYFFCGQNVACVSHGITKKSAVPAHEIDTAVERKARVERDLDRFTAEWG